jgi:hypothetical protein
MALPLLVSMAQSLPPQSGTYATPFTTVAVAETLPAVVKTHLGFNLPTLPASMA